MNSRRLKAMLEMLKKEKNYHVLDNGVIAFNEPVTELDNFEELKIFQNSHMLFNEISNKIRSESDINQVKEIALDYLNYICSEMPDNMAKKVSKRIIG